MTHNLTLIIFPVPIPLPFMSQQASHRLWIMIHLLLEQAQPA
jgi:hypothetical protein